MTFPRERLIADASFPKGRTYSPPRSGGSALLRRARNNDRYVQEGGDSA